MNDQSTPIGFDAIDELLERNAKEMATLDRIKALVEEGYSLPEVSKIMGFGVKCSGCSSKMVKPEGRYDLEPGWSRLDSPTGEKFWFCIDCDIALEEVWSKPEHELGDLSVNLPDSCIKTVIGQIQNFGQGLTPISLAQCVFALAEAGVEGADQLTRGIFKNGATLIDLAKTLAETELTLDVIEKALVENRRELDEVRRIRSLRSKGYTLSQIAEVLNP